MAVVFASAEPDLGSEPGRAINSCYQVLVPQYLQLAQSGDVNTTNCYAWWDAELSLSHWNALPWSQFLGKLPREAGQLGNKGPLSGFASCPAKPDLFGTWSIAKLCAQWAGDLEGGRGSRWQMEASVNTAPTNTRPPPGAACQRQHGIGSPSKALGKGYATTLRQDHINIA